MARLAVRKTYKLFIGGQFPRSESGRHTRLTDMQGDFVANVCQASRKDLRDAVVAARKAQAPWAKRTAFNRAQILYRVAEGLEARRETFVPLVAAGLSGAPRAARAAAEREVDAAIDRLVGYAGWADKLSIVFGSVNPVAAPFFNFTTPEPTGVVVLFAPPSAALAGLAATLAPILVPGNTVVGIAPTANARVALELAEVIATSDVPPGVVNLLTGAPAELAPHAATHVDVDAITTFGVDAASAEDLEGRAAESVKRVRVRSDDGHARWCDASIQSPYEILPFVEFRTAWHPVGR